MRIVITGGHHSSALPVIDELKKNHKDIEIFWFGHKYSVLGDKNVTLEYREITEMGIPFYDLKAGKVYRTFNLNRWLKVPFGFFQALYLLTKVNPDIILSFGGYLAVPVVLAGFILNKPCITHEQTVVTGYANKVISIFAKRILVSWPESTKFFKKDKVKIVGLPLRKEIFVNKTNSFEVNPNLPSIYVTGGKTGSMALNNAVSESLPDLLNKANVIIQCGDHSEYKPYENISNIYQSLKDRVAGKLILRKFIYANEIGEIYAKASLIISRSGAHTVVELLSLEKPCLLVPIPWVSHNEQYKNALVLKKAGLGEILEEKDLNKENLLCDINKMLEHISSYKIKDPEIKNVIRENSAELIVEEVLQAAK